MRSVGLASFHGQDDLLRLAGLMFIVEIDSPVDAFVCAFLLFRWSRADKPQRPPLELIWIGLGERLSAANVYWFAQDRVLS